MGKFFVKKGGEKALGSRISDIKRKITSAIARYKEINLDKEQAVWLMTLRNMEAADASLKGHSGNLALSWNGKNCFEVELLNQKKGTGREVVTSPDILGYTPIITSQKNMATRKNYETVFCRNSLFLESREKMAMLMSGKKYFEGLENIMSADPSFADKLERPGTRDLLRGAAYGGIAGAAIAGISSAIINVHPGFVAGFAGTAALIFGARSYMEHKKMVRTIEFACKMGEEVSASAEKIVDAIEYNSRELLKLNRELEKREAGIISEQLNLQEPLTKS
ncbi:MAG: hypothetical protein ACLFUZ_03400 [Candidatus Micrarchaeia archaeon]